MPIQRPTVHYIDSTHYWPMLPIIDPFCPLLTHAAHYWPILPIIDPSCPLLTQVAHYWPMLPIIDQCCPLLTSAAHYWPILPTIDPSCPLLTHMAYYWPILAIIDSTDHDRPMLTIIEQLWPLVSPTNYSLALPILAQRPGTWLRLLSTRVIDLDIYCLSLSFHPRIVYHSRILMNLWTAHSLWTFPFHVCTVLPAHTFDLLLSYWPECANISHLRVLMMFWWPVHIINRPAYRLWRPILTGIVHRIVCTVSGLLTSFRHLSQLPIFSCWWI